MLEGLAFRDQFELELAHTCDQIRRSLCSIRQWPMLPPRIRENMFYRQVVWQAGSFIKLVTGLTFKLGENVLKSILLDIAILTTRGNRAAEFGVIRETHRIAFESGKCSRAVRNRYTLHAELI